MELAPSHNESSITAPFRRCIFISACFTKKKFRHFAIFYQFKLFDHPLLTCLITSMSSWLVRSSCFVKSCILRQKLLRQSQIASCVFSGNFRKNWLKSFFSFSTFSIFLFQLLPIFCASLLPRMNIPLHEFYYAIIVKPVFRSSYSREKTPDRSGVFCCVSN